MSHFNLPDGHVVVRVEIEERTLHFAVKEEDAHEYVTRMGAVLVEWDGEKKMDALVLSHRAGEGVSFDLETTIAEAYPEGLLAGHAPRVVLLGPPDSPRNRLQDLVKRVGFSDISDEYLLGSPPCKQFSSLGQPVELSQRYLDDMTERLDERLWSSPSCEHPPTPRPTKKEPTTWFGRTQREMRSKVSKRRAKNKNARKSRRRNRK